MIEVEICANSVQSAINAEKGGADRIELCQNLNEGGTTPSYAAIKYCAENLSLKTMVLIRPRPGDFCYNDAEYEAIKEDVLMCKKLGVHGVVIGFLDKNLDIDTKRTAEIVKLAHPMEVTFHRAFDRCRDWHTALEQIIECGCDRILTSGQRKTAPEGADNLREIQKQANGRIKILAGSGVNSQNVADLIQATGVSEVHSSCKHTVENLQKTNIEDSSRYMETNLEEVKRFVGNAKQSK
ncbi:MAG: copper homeostasis protein CutC [Bacteroidales bacterium]|nr:copper homeostasis protein CutC [Bacteroidales bacterium]